MLNCQRCNRLLFPRLAKCPTVITARCFTSSTAWWKQHELGSEEERPRHSTSVKNVNHARDVTRHDSTVVYSPLELANRSHHQNDNDRSLVATQNKQEWLDSRGVRPPGQRKNTMKVPPHQPKNFHEMKKHLQYLQDPVKLADAVKDCLRQDKLEKAQEMVLAASKGALVTVSWNHIINYLLQKKRVNAAIKIFNDMKKRAQIPDAHTYTIIFRGLADMEQAKQSNQNYLGNCQKAISIYQSMLATNSPVKPSIIHTNAVMKVCGRAGDIDAMMGIAAQLQEKGLRAPNTLTFTTIFNAMRLHVQTEKDEPTSTNLKRKMTSDARRIWFDVISRWRKGDMRIDEELVCSLGRLLLLGNAKDVDDIFTLLQQTMNIPRQLPVLGTKSRDRIDPSQQGNKAQDVLAKQATKPEEYDEDASQEVITSLDDVVPDRRWEGDLHTSLTAVQLPYPNGEMVKPGQNTLSLVADALLKPNMKEVMVRYWKLLTQEFAVNPDGPNYHAYLRVLKTARASSEAVNLVLAMPRRMVEYKTIRIAMSTCGRDKMNPGAFLNAGKLLDLMQTCLNDADIGVLHTYLEVCVGGKDTVREACQNDATKYAHGQRILRGLTRLDPHLNNMKFSLSFDKPPAVELSSKNRSYVDEKRNGLLSLLAEMVSSYDQLLNYAMIPRESYSDVMARRSAAAAFITRNLNKTRKEKKSQIIRDASNISRETSRTSGDAGEELFTTKRSPLSAYEHQFRSPNAGTYSPNNSKRAPTGNIRNADNSRGGSVVRPVNHNIVHNARVRQGIVQQEEEEEIEHNTKRWRFEEQPR